MQMWTGLLLASLLLAKGRGSRSRLPSFPGVLETVHALPGRLRLRVPGLCGASAIAREIEERLQQLDGISAAAASPVSGSLLITYDPDQVQPEILIAVVIRLLGLGEQVEQAPASRLGREIRDLGDALNQAVHRQTGGLIDLWTALPLGLGAAGARSMMRKDRKTGVPMLWWAYRSLLGPNRSRDW